MRNDISTLVNSDFTEVGSRKARYPNTRLRLTSTEITEP